ncbi:isocitrate/isopropylmalate dehydrogenase family protein [Luteolibacter algae]|uniref:3-isopropylmalate dehydrogenase n=1 Tax=Luteolibacter algae TaxID=454151 RepID=A0ABW5DCE6_9BACT
MSLRIALLPGDGIGPDVTYATVEVLKALESKTPELSFEFHEQAVGAAEYLRSGSPLPEEAFEACRAADAVLLGAMGLPDVRWPDGKEMTPQIDLRERLDLYAGLRPIKLYHPDDSPLKGYGSERPIDFVLVRESTEGLFSARLNQADSGGDESRDVMRITRRGAERVCRKAFELARKRRKKCTLVDKANVLPSMVFFRRIFDEVGEEFPDVTREHVYVDAMALFMVRKPDAYDVIVTENMFGDILSDLAAGIVGGMGMAPSGDVGNDCGIFQPSHGTAPDIAGKDIANPVATILSAAMMLDWLGHADPADRIESAVSRVLADPSKRTPDMNGKLGTAEMTAAVIAEL